MVLNSYSFSLVVSALVSGGMALYVWRKHGRGLVAGPLISFMLAAALWACFYALELAVTAVPLKILFAQIEYLGITSTAPMAFVMVNEYITRERWTDSRKFLLLGIIPFIVNAAVFTNTFHGLFWTDITPVQIGSFLILKVKYGPFFWLNAVYAYLLLLWATWQLARVVIREEALHRAQAGVMLAGILLPWLGNFLYIFGINPFPGLDLTPYSFTLTGLAFAWGLFRLKLFNLLPVARSAVIENMPDGVIVLDAGDQVMDVNPAAQKTLGVAVAEIIGQPADVVFSQHFPLPAPVRQMPETLTEVVSSQSAEEQYFNVLVTPLKNRSGRNTGRIITLHNATPLKQAEIRLRTSQQQLEAQNAELRKFSRAVEQSGSSVIITNLQGVIEFVNPVFTRITGYKPEEAIGHTPAILKSGKHGPELYREMWQIISRGDIWQGELINKKKNGEFYWEAVTISPVKDAAGQITHYLAIKDDVTRRKEMELALAQARDEALEASRMKGQLLANVSHDMRSPLGSILGFTEMLQQGIYGAVSGRQYEILTKIIQSTEQLLNFLNNLINQAHIESGKIVLNARPFPPADVFDSIQSTAAALAQAKNLLITHQIEADVPPLIYGDPYWIRQIVSNLISNAVKFTEHGSIDVCISRPTATHWAIQVTDTGIGIPAEAQAHIFESFWQVDGGITKKQTSGSGLGLSIVKQLVTLMGGEISLISQVNQGATFTITLPLVENTGEQGK